jgi:hypothetical protein
MHFTPLCALWLGRLHHAADSGQSLGAYAKAHGLRLAELLTWERRLAAAGISVPARPPLSRFVAVELRP